MALQPGETVHVNMRRIGVAANGTTPDFASLGISAAIIDTGVDRRHPDLNVVGGKSFSTNDPNPDPFSDGLGHGTHVAGILGAKNNGRGILGAAPGGWRESGGVGGGGEGARGHGRHMAA